MTHPAPAAGFVTISQGLYDLWMAELAMMHRTLDGVGVPRKVNDVELSVSQRVLVLAQANEETRTVILNWVGTK